MPSLKKALGLHVLLQATDAENRLLQAIRCPDSGEGLIPALELVETSLAALTNTGQLARAELWLRICSALLRKCRRLEEDNTSLGFLPHDQTPPVFCILAHPPACQLTDDIVEKLMEVLGRLIAAAASSGTALSVTAVNAWATLRRAGKERKGMHDDWLRIVNAIPLTHSTLNNALKLVTVTGLRTLLEELKVALATSLIEPATVAKTSSNNSDQKNDIGQPEFQRHLEAENSEADTEEQDANFTASEHVDEKLALTSPTGWLIQQANFARHTQKFGLIGDRDHLHPRDLRQVCKRLMATFSSGDKEIRDKVALAHLSLKSGLPSRLAIHLPLAPTSYPWVDIERGELHWNYRLALDNNSKDPTIQLPPRGEVEIIQIKLDADVAQHLRERVLLSSVDVPELGVLLGIGNAANTSLSAYRQFLHSHGDPVHPAYDGRFSRSAGDTYRHVCGSDMAPPFMAQDFHACAMGILHYTTFPASFLRKCNEEFDQFLGFRTAPAQTGESYKGALTFITSEDFRHGWSKLQSLTQSALDDFEHATTVDKLIKAFNALACNRLLAFITLTAHRGSKLSRLTWRALYTHRHHIFFNDKDVGDYQSDRVVPAHRLVDQVLACWQMDVHKLRQRAVDLGLKLWKDGRRALDVNNPDQTAFFHVKFRSENNVASILRKPVDRTKLASAAQATFERPTNIGRHFLVSQLLLNGVDIWLVRVLTGHSRSYAEPFSDAMGVAPVIALEKLRLALDQLFASLALAPVQSQGDYPSTRKLIDLIGLLPQTATDLYLHPRVNAGLRVLPRPFDQYSLTAIRIVDGLRTAMLKTNQPHSAGPTLVAALTLFDTMDPEDQKVAFEDLSKAFVQIGKTACVIWNRPGCSHEICMPLNPRTVMVLPGLDVASDTDWHANAAAVGHWAKLEYPQLSWPANNFEAYESLAALALRWRRYRCSPSALTAQSRAIPAATPSRRSLLRIAAKPQQGTVLSDLGKAVRRSAKKQHTKTTGLLNNVAKKLREASRSMAYGNDRTVAASLKTALLGIDTSSDLRAANLKDVTLHEVNLRLQRNPEMDEFSSLAGYLDDVLPAFDLLFPSDDLSSFSCEEFEEWVDAAKSELDRIKKDTDAVKLDKPRYFGLKRLLRSGSSLGWDVPKGLFSTDGSRSAFDGMRRSAASTVMLEQDHLDIQKQLLNHFEDWPVLSQRSLLAHDLLTCASLRSTEQIVLRRNCIVSTTGALCIQEDGFSHLKSRHAPRLIELPPDLCDRIEKIRNDPNESKSRYLFLPDDAADWNMSREIDEALISAAVLVTGDAAFRKHCLRAAAICKRAWPQWETMARAFCNGNWTPEQYSAYCNSIVDFGFAHFIFATREAGHGHPIVTLVYYCAPWPFVLAAQLAASLVGVEPEAAVIKHTLGTTDGIRAAKSRAAKEVDGSFSVWVEVTKACVKKLRLPTLKTLDAPVVIAPQAIDDPQQQPSVIALVRFAAELLMGRNLTQCSQDHGIAKPLAHRLEALLPHDLEKETLIRRRRGVASQDSLKDDLFFLAGEFSSHLIRALVTAPPDYLSALGEDLSHVRPNPRKPALSPHILMDRLQKHLYCLPAPTVGLQLRFSTEHPRTLSPTTLVTLGPRLVVGSDNSRIGAYPMFQIVNMNKIDNAVATGRYTAVTRILVAAVLGVFKLQKGE